MNPQRLAGTGHLGVEVVSGSSTATSVWAASPLKILTPRPRGPFVWACLSSYGGGLVAGDELALQVELGEGARCFVTTQASTKVYRNPNDRPCSQRLRANLKSGAVLVLAPDPVQAFAESRYQQHQEFSMEPGSGLVLVDWLCSGRSARGERWAFTRFQSRNEICVAGSRVLVDSLLLDPADGPLESRYRMARFNCLGLVIVAGGPFRATSARLLESVAALPVSRQPLLICSASPILHGALLRVAGESVEAVRSEIRRVLGFLGEYLLEDPWSRKW